MKNKQYKKSIFGIGINDSRYEKRKKVNGEYVLCPYYRIWVGMFKRCYSKNFQEKYPTYIGCTVCDGWVYFSAFKDWMMKQDYKGKHLDKDLMIQGNKVYSPSTCLFVSQKINNLLKPNNSIRGRYKLGVSFSVSAKRLQADCKNGNGSPVHLGYFYNEDDAHLAYCNYKYELIASIAATQEDPLRTALLNYKIKAF